ncbi:MAG: LamG domain-containing protein, partial [Candidatus Viridilinea halotolerans]
MRMGRTALQFLVTPKRNYSEKKPMHRSPLTWLIIIALVVLPNLMLQPQTNAQAPLANSGSALRLFGSSSNDRDRIKIPLGTISSGQLTSSYPVNVATDFTIEFWMRADATNNAADPCDSGSGNVGWYYGNILVDRDIFGENDGDYGIALRGGRIIFGVNNGNRETNLCGNIHVTTGQWHHIAVTRNASSGLMRIFVDGQLDRQADGPTGSIAYPVGRNSAYANDPYLVLGAEKHDYPGSLYYNGLFDDLRISNVVRY